MPFAFALLSPDCVQSGSTGPVLRFMAERRVQVIAYRWHQLSAAEVAQLYASNRSSRPSTVLDQLVDELFSLSASLCCLVKSREGLEDEALHQFLLDIKGPSDPFKCRPDQLRRALGATNKLLNLVHTSDSPMDTLREAAIFFPETHHLTDQSPGIALETLYNESPRQPVAISGFRTMNDLKRAALVAGGRDPSSDALERSVDLEKQLLESQADQVTLFSQLQEILGQQRRSAAAMKPSILQVLMDKLISISARTTDAGNTSPDVATRALDTLQRIGVNTSAWEALVMRVEQRMAAPRSIAA